MSWEEVLTSAGEAGRQLNQCESRQDGDRVVAGLCSGRIGAKQTASIRRDWGAERGAHVGTWRCIDTGRSHGIALRRRFGLRAHVPRAQRIRHAAKGGCQKELIDHAGPGRDLGGIAANREKLWPHDERWGAPHGGLTTR